MSEPFWAVVELMGHNRTAGRVSEEERFGVKMGRIDIPRDDGEYTQFFGGQSVFRITPVEEAVARAVAKECQSVPVSAWELPKMLAPPVEEEDDYDDDLYGLDDDEDDDEPLAPDGPNVDYASEEDEE